MRRWLAVAALGAALLTIPAWGQRRGGGGASFGGRAGFGGHPGFASHPMGGFRGPMRTGGFSGGHWGGGHWGRGFHHRPFPHGGSCWGGRCFYHHHHFYSGYPWGYGYGYWPYAYAGWGWPWWGDDYGMDNYASQAPPSTYYPQAQESPQAQAEIDRLHDEVARLSDQLQSSSRAVPRPAEQKEPAPEPTQLVFADKHTEEIHNYAIVRQTLWVFDGSRSRKIPLASLDILATRKANEEQGVDFQIPD